MNDKTLKELWEKDELCSFWLKRRTSHPLLSDLAMKFMLPFYTSYLCEKGFSSLLYIKNKYRSAITEIESSLRLKLSNMKPDIKQLCTTKQKHKSH